MLSLSLALRTLVAAQPAVGGALGAAVRHAVALRLSPAEAAAERPIDALRARLAASPETVEVVDYGAGTRGGARPPVRRVADMYARAASGAGWGRVLFGLVRAQRPARVLELGTHLGLSAAHTSAALALTAAEGGPDGRLVTLEGAPAVAALAEGHLRALGHGPERVRVVVGPFAATLAGVCATEGPFDLVFVDGHHEEEAALRYVETVRPHLAPGALVILDDVEPGRPVARAWRRLRAAAPEAPAVSLGKWGLLGLGPADLAAPVAADEGAASRVVRPT